MYVLLSCCEWIMSATFRVYRPIWREGVTEVTEIGKRGPELRNIRRSTRPAPTLPPVSGGPTSVDRARLPDAGKAENPHRRREERAPSPAVAGQPLPTLEAHPVRTVVRLRGTSGGRWVTAFTPWERDPFSTH